MVFENYKTKLFIELDKLYAKTKNVTNLQLYKLALSIIKNEYLTDAFLISEIGGFDKYLINRIKKDL